VTITFPDGTTTTGRSTGLPSSTTVPSVDGDVFPLASVAVTPI
jgi:hypothetical protein